MTRANTRTHEYQIEPGLRAEHRALAARGYWDAFSRKLHYPLGPEHKAIAFVKQVLDPDHAISAVSASGDFLGVAGFKTSTGAFVGGDLGDLQKIYGTLGGIARGLLISALERECDDNSLLMDGIFVQEQARGLGVGTALLGAIEHHAAKRGLEHVRLDVIDSNARARALYERQGFQEQSTTSTGILRHVFGFAHATTMIKPIGVR